VVSYLAGTPLSAVSVTPKLVRHFGRCAANLDLVLANYEHAGDNQVLLWDLQRAGDLRELITYVEESELRVAVSLCLDDFDRRVQPKLSLLRRQVIHGDLNGGNVLVAEDHESIVGVIDFGDMVRAPLIMEIAIAAAYLRVGDGEALSLIAPFIAGYNSITALEDVELELLFDLIRARLVATITILRWRLAMRGKDDDYTRQSLESECSAENFLLRLDTLGRISFAERVRDACNISAP
jgi:Ser/Thr protein kinase RdoA (MazF antagonist)